MIITFRGRWRLTSRPSRRSPSRTGDGISGGDEFPLLLPRTTLDQPEPLLERIAAADLRTSAAAMFDPADADTARSTG